MNATVKTQTRGETAKDLAMVDFRELITQGCFTHDMVELNSVGRENFTLSGYPERKDERFTYVDLLEVKNARLHLRKEPSYTNREEVERLLFPSATNSRIVFVDGVFIPYLSDMTSVRFQIELLPLGVAMERYPQVKKELLDSAFAEQDPFANLNAAFAMNGAYLKINDGEQLKSPVEIIYFSAEYKTPTLLSAPRLFVDIGEKAKAAIIFKNMKEQGPYLFNAVSTMAVRAQAQASVYHLALNHSSAARFSKLGVIQYAHSSVKMVTVNAGAKTSRWSFDWKLREPGASMELKSLAPLHGKSQNHIYSRVTHEAPDCSSQLLFKNIVDGEARSSVDSTVIVDPGARGSASHQLINNLLLSDGARADNKPNLMIHNDDVQCSHGVTIGQLDEETLFYFMSRGMGKAEASRSLINGFAREVTDAILEPYALAVVEENVLLHKRGIV